MLLDARSVKTNIETDICIVGGGLAGITLARELIGRAFRVCLLESGGTTPDLETQALYFGENVGLPYFPLDAARARSFGGSSTRWHIPIGNRRLGVRLRPLDPTDFEKRDWVPYSGWPFTRSHLDPYYERAQGAFRIEGLSWSVNDWANPRDLRVLPLDGAVQSIVYKFGRREIFAREYPDEVSKAENLTCIMHANVLEIEADPTGEQVRDVLIATLEGNRFSVTAKFLVLAAGGIETARLLLLSNRTRGAGLGNQHDLVGRFFMEHPHFWSGILVPALPDPFRTSRLYSRINTGRGVPFIAKLALKEEVLRREKLLNQNVQLIPHRIEDSFGLDGGSGQSMPPPAALTSARELLSAMLDGRKPAGVLRHLRNISGGLDKIAWMGARKIQRDLFGPRLIPVFVFANMLEPVPNPESRVKLGNERDCFGQNRVQLDWRMTTQDIRSARRTQQLIAAELEQAGIGSVYLHLREDVTPQNIEGGYHHMGTTRMHVDPKQGVVDPDCRVHGIKNLFVAGPSVFPTVGYANPALTVVALAIRLADHLKKLIEKGGMASGLM